jgi:hypothetical protein
MAKPWEQVGGIVGILSLLVAIVALVSSLVVPEIRCYLGLKADACSPVPTPTVPQVPSNELPIVKSYFIEIFFLKGRDDLQREATDIRSRLIEYGFNAERVVLKPVGEEVLQGLEYPNSNEIRFDIGTEENPAESLRQLLETIAPNKTFNLRDANNPEPTKGYISIFLLP